jgi:predicted alpha/beta superfamily hydrolase
LNHNNMEQTLEANNTAGGDVVPVAGAVQYVMCSRRGNHEYRIFVFIPNEAPPPAGFPVIYLLDANSVFGTMVEAVRLQGTRSEKTGVVPAVIVGIGYKTETPFSSARYYDFTMSVPVEELPVRPDGKAWPELGGAKNFLIFIEDELKPMIESQINIDTRRQTICGHSLGGLFVLQSLFSKPSSFCTYIAGSPSIHWNKRYFLEEEQPFVSRLEQQQNKVRILIAVGELEQNHPSGMNNNARGLYERLSSLPGGYVDSEFKEFEGEGHVSVLPALISRALRFALKPDSPHA